MRPGTTAKYADDTSRAGEVGRAGSRRSSQEVQSSGGANVTQAARCTCRCDGAVRSLLLQKVPLIGGFQSE